jgi:hypothetical protein
MPRNSHSVYDYREVQPKEAYKQGRQAAKCAPHGEGPLPSLSLIGQTLRKIALHLHAGRWTIAVRVLDTARESVIEERVEASNERTRRAEIQQLMEWIDDLLASSKQQESTDSSQPTPK